MSEERSQLSNNIRYLRRVKNGWTQQEFADKVGIKRSLLGAYEESRAEPKLEYLERMAHLLQVSVDSLVQTDLVGDASIPGPGRRPLNSPSNKNQSISQKIESKRENNYSLTNPLSFDGNKPHSKKQESFYRADQLRVLSIIKKAENEEASAEVITPSQLADYIKKHRHADYLSACPTRVYPDLETNMIYRVFQGIKVLNNEVEVLSAYQRNWLDIENNLWYVMVTGSYLGLVKLKNEMIDHRRLMISEGENVNEYIHANDILEIWEVKRFSLSPDQFTFHSEKGLANELRALREEMNALKRD